MMPEDTETDGLDLEVVGRVTGAFLILTDDYVVEPLKPLAEAGCPWASLTGESIEGLKAIVHAATLPFYLTFDRVQNLRFDRIHTAERIRSLKDVRPNAGLTPELEAHAYRRASERMKALAERGEIHDFVLRGVVEELDRALSSPSLRAAAYQLLVQALVATWGAFEVFASSFIITSVNANPSLATRILSEPDSKRHFGKPVVDIAAIDAHGFNLTDSMGTVLFADRRLDNLTVIRDILNAILPEEAVRVALGGDSMWLLNQRRHLFVHRRGVVDRDYLHRTSDAAALGSQLEIDSDVVEGYLLNVRDAIAAIVTAAS